MEYEKNFINCLIVHKPEEGYRLSHHLHHSCKEAKTLEVLSNWEEAIRFLEYGHKADLIIGSFELTDLHPFVFEKLDKKIPVIFTSTKPFVTEKAFSLNCMDFLNDDPSEDRLAKSFEKYKRLYSQNQISTTGTAQSPDTSQPKSRFLVKSGEKLFYKNPKDVAFFLAEGGLTYLVEMDTGEKFIVDHKLKNLEDQYLDPQQFFRINRSIILNIKAIHSIKKYPNNRLQITPKTSYRDEIIVSREKVSKFKNWMNQ
ncbi:LytTR family DNA-binding domain-containing protein [Echinicola jeungdonensis]|uniref:LytR/AlgR family response regulator transcription factor n=1 Tax=Echinicola jeungdonensis TaxID=709343 RepID=A0ABV5J1X7_9BACT|nr:LytTR family DNA-binding domain-containing protein [Echinicola jeungdonensis]MDN3668993.1 LytTR family DNA-binding domain-containing protein [Echinicola jeungdonensis]